MSPDTSGIASATELDALTDVEATPQSRPACMACGHSPDQHDKIALRFCDATVERAFTRGCICRVPALG
jgi:hypothetical protein